MYLEYIKLLREYFDHVSFSALQQFERCELQTYYRYLMKIKAPPSVAMIEGTAGHKGLEENYKQKIITYRDLPLDDVLDATRDSFKEGSKYVEKWDEENPSKVEKRILSTAKEYHKIYAPTIQPINSEEKIVVDVDGIDFVAYIDFETESDIHDSKFTTKTKNQKSVDRDLQFGIYSLLKQKRSVTVDCIIKSIESPKVVPVQCTEKNETDWLRTKYRLQSLLVRMAQTLKSGCFKASTAEGWWCSPKFCGYWNQCPQGGGDVKRVTFDMSKH